MSGLGGLNKTRNGVVIGLVQLQNPIVARHSNPAMDLVVVHVDGTSSGFAPPQRFFGS